MNEKSQIEQGPFSAYGMNMMPFMPTGTIQVLGGVYLVNAKTEVEGDTGHSQKHCHPRSLQGHPPPPARGYGTAILFSIIDLISTEMKKMYVY